jgi:hypothetical protein
MLSRGAVTQIDRLLSGQITAAKLFAPYRVDAFVTAHSLMILSVWLNALLGFLLATLIKWRDSVTSLAVGGVFVMYFLNNVSQMLSSANWLRWLSTFGYFSLETPVTAGMTGILLLSLTALSAFALWHFKSADLVR